MKVCARCEVKKSLDQFYSAPHCVDGVRGECKECRNEKERIKRFRLRLLREEYRPDPGSKCCSRCGKAKLLEKFYNSIYNADGRRSECMECAKKYRKNPSAESVAKWKSAERERNKLIPRKRLSAAIRQAALRDSVHITIDDLLGLWRDQDGCCAVTGIKMVWGIGDVVPNSISLDKIDPRGTYTRDNIRLVCYQVNVFKNKWDDSQMFQMAMSIISNIKKPKLRVVS